MGPEHLKPDDALETAGQEVTDIPEGGMIGTYIPDKKKEINKPWSDPNANPAEDVKKAMEKIVNEEPRSVPTNYEQDKYREVIDEILVYVDGACSGNPGPGAAGWYTDVDYFARYLSEHGDKCTNNIAEYEAARMGLMAHKKHKRMVVIVSDSQLVVNQMNGTWELKDDNLFMIAAKCKDIRMKRSIDGLKTEYRNKSRIGNKAHYCVEQALKNKKEVKKDE